MPSPSQAFCSPGSNHAAGNPQGYRPMNIIATYELGEPQPFRPVPTFSYWNTAKLGDMVKLARDLLKEKQAAFDATLAVERRRGKRSWESEEAGDYARRAEDRLQLMVAELRRRASECLTERRKGPRLGPEYRREDIWSQLPAPIMNQAAVAME